MKTLSFLILFCAFQIAFLAHAGRETHGVLPNDHFICQNEQDSDQGVHVELPITDKKVTAARLNFPDNKSYLLQCFDQYSPAKITEKMSETVLCFPRIMNNDLNQNYRLELFESKSKAQIRIWKIRAGRSDQMIKALPCY